ncbi:MAG: hypothetical protein HY699_17015 [Deltaproteobacteria bacterium]|nr:hypothetical protein [Deltaproteobacteria bacterium]
MNPAAAPAAERRQTFLVVRYVLILAVGSLAVVEKPLLPAGIVALICGALLSNLALRWVPIAHFFRWWVQGPILISDTVWVSVVLLSGNLSQEFFLFFFVLFLAAISESLGLLAVGAVLIGTASLVLAGSAATLSAASLIRVPFFFAAALFYGYIVDNTKQERRAAAEQEAWAKELAAQVRARTRELEQQSQQLRRLYHRVIEANRLKSEFVANMSHELRSPLNIIIGYIDLLMSGEFGALPQEAVDICEHVDHNARKLHRLMENVLDFAKLEEHQVVVRRSAVAVPTLVRQVVAAVCQPRPADVTIAVDVPSDLPAIETDAPKLSAIIEQLLSNAIKFTPPRGRITVSVCDLSAEGRLRFALSDTGMGIRPAHLKLIFEDFRQIDGTSTRAHGGLGLGLALVRRYVGLLGGEITVASELGRGSSFCFTLPYRLNGQVDKEQLIADPLNGEVATAAAETEESAAQSV